MLIIPEIDLKAGRCVQPKQDSMIAATLFTENPDEMAAHWLKVGAKRLHIVDLPDTATLNNHNRTKNLSAVRDILAVIGDTISVQLGGGINALSQIEQYLDIGVKYIIIGSAAIKTPGFLHEACDAFPGHIMVGLDAKRGKIITDSWTRLTNHDPIELAKRFEDYGIEAVIYTDIGEDSLPNRLDIALIKKFAQSLQAPVLVNSHLQSLDDIHSLSAIAEEGLAGVIASRFIYQEGGLDFKAAQNIANGLG